MSTPYDKIYARFTTLSENYQWAYLTEYDRYKYFDRLLDYAVGEFEGYCYKMIADNRTEFVSDDFWEVSDGSETVYILSTSLVDPSIYVAVENAIVPDTMVQLTEAQYTYVDNTHTLTLTEAPAADLRIHIVPYIIGSFTDTLNQTEINILAYGMLIAFKQQLFNNPQLLQQTYYGIGAKMYSQAEHMSRLSGELKSAREKLIADINRYTFSHLPGRIPNDKIEEYLELYDEKVYEG